MDNESSGASVTQSLKRNSGDVGWDYGKLVDPNVLERVQCILCGKIMSGGIHRLKEHVAHISGNVAKCSKAKPEDINKCKSALMESKNRKRNKMIDEKLKRGEVNINESEEREEVEVGGVRKEPHHLGPIDRFTRPINPELSQTSKKSMRQQNINEALFKERLDHVHTWVTTWMFNRAVPWHHVVNDDFMRACEEIGQFGPGYRPPNYYEIGERYLPNRVDETKLLLKRQEEEWAKNGCSIMTDAWTDRKRRSIMNLCVNCRLGTAFLSSKECSDVAHTGQHIFEYVNACIEQVGPTNIVQIVTDNASNNMAAAKILKENRPNIFWTSCAAHTINLMLESIGKLSRFGKYIEQAKQLTIFIYAHHKTLGMMRSFTKKKDIVRPGKTRFASAFLTLQSLMDKKNALKTMFGSEEWEKCKYSKSKKGKLAYEVVMSLAFWNGVTCCLKVFAPLIKVLKLVDGDRKPSMPWLYGELRKAKQDIKEALNNVENNYRSIIEIIDSKMKDRLDSPLHKTAFLLNPYYHYKDSSISDETELLNGFMECVEIFHHGDIASQDVIIMTEWPLYQMKDGPFGRPLAIRGCDNDSKDPVTWWSMFGSHTPNILKLAKRILSLTTSSSGCERNWSNFEWIHSKKRNRLNTNRLNDLVFVNFNSQLSSNVNKQVEKNVDVILAANADAADAQGWLVPGGDNDDEVGAGLERPRQLDEDDFNSGEEEEEERGEKNIDVEFESDNEQVMEDVYGDDEDWLHHPSRP